MQMVRMEVLKVTDWSRAPDGMSQILHELSLDAEKTLPLIPPAPQRRAVTGRV